MRTKKGFTLIELLIVIGIISVLMAIAIIAVNPAAQFAKANDAARWAGVNTILNAVSQNIIDGRGIWTCATDLLSTATTMASTGFDICSCLVTDYIGALPVDPDTSVGSYTDCSTYNTGYEIKQVSGRVTVSAPEAQGGTPISVTR